MARFVSQGALVLMDCGRSASAPPPGGGRRGEITTFSPQSRRRLRQRLHRLRWPSSVLFLTLTFDPRRFTPRWKYQLHRFIVAFLKAYPGWGVVWKLEPHKSGFPHFHLLLIPPVSESKPFIPHDWLEQLWGLGFVWVERVFQNRIAAYLAKYVYKGVGPRLEPSLDGGDISETPVPTRWGRFWGMRGTLVWAPVKLGAPDWAIRQARALRRALEKKLGVPIRGWLAVFLDRQVT